METDNRATVQRTAVVASVLLFVGIVVTAGLSIGATTGPSGEAVLNETRSQYANAETVVVDATVTVRNDSATKEFDVSAVAAEGNRSRVTVTGDDRNVTVGTNGSAAWLSTPETPVALVLQNGTVRTTGPVGAFANASTPGNVSGLNGSTTGNLSKLNFSEFENASVIGNGSELNYSAMGAVDRSPWAGGPDARKANVSVERVETTDYEGTRAHVVSVTPKNESVDVELRMWVDAENSTVLRQRLTTPNGTVAVDVHRTRFDASVADSEFEPPAAGPDAVGVRTVEDAESLHSETPFEAVTPVAGFDLDRGVVVERRGNTTAFGQFSNATMTVRVVQTTATSVPSMAAAMTDADVDAGVEVENTTTRTVNDTTVTVSHVEGQTIVRWDTGDGTVVVAGDLTADRLLEVVSPERT